MLRIGKVQITGGPNPTYLGITLIIFMLNWVVGLLWLAFWLIVGGAMIAYFNRKKNVMSGLANVLADIQKGQRARGFQGRSAKDIEADLKEE